MKKQFGYISIILMILISSATAENSYSVQIASFQHLSKAFFMYNSIRATGFPAEIYWLRDSKKDKWYIVHIGNFKTRADADKAAAIFTAGTGQKNIIKKIDSALLNKRTITGATSKKIIQNAHKQRANLKNQYHLIQKKINIRWFLE